MTTPLMVVSGVEEAGRLLAALVTRETELEDGRAAVKQSAILTLMQEINPLTNKPHSASSADAVVETVPEYAEYRARQVAATAARIIGWACYDAQKLRAELAVKQSDIL